jgi:branched-chain amino acid transport system ATP-binding protein
MSAPALELRQVHKSFGQTPIINGVDLTIAKGERHAIIGNGAGRSRCSIVSGRFAPSSGQILLGSEGITGLDAQASIVRARAQFQITNIFPRLSVYENVRVPCSGRAGTVTRSGNGLARSRTFARAPRDREQDRFDARRDRPAGSCHTPSSGRWRSVLPSLARPRDPVGRATGHEPERDEAVGSFAM